MKSTLTKEVVEARLRDFADSQGVRVLMAVESGSRGWGFPGKDSDWDCRFIYTRPRESYETVYSLKEQITYEDKEFDGDLDMIGWDLRKALRAAANSNIVMSEWAQSPLRYSVGEEGFNEEFLEKAVAPWYKHREGLHAYLGMANSAKGSVPDVSPDPSTGEGMGLTPAQFHLATGLSSKKFMYYARCVLAAGASSVDGDPPPMDLEGLLALHEREWNTVLVSSMRELVGQKATLGEKSYLSGPVMPALVQWLHSMENSARVIKNGLVIPDHPAQSEVDKVYQDMLGRWG